MKDIKDKRLKKLISRYGDRWNINSINLGNYVFNMKTPIDDLWNIYFILRLILEIHIHHDWICFCNRYMGMNENDD